MSHVNIVKKIKIDGEWKLLSIPRNAKGNYDWNALPDGLYLIEWRAGGKRRRESAGRWLHSTGTPFGRPWRSQPGGRPD